MNILCKNCNCSTFGNYCSNCGQRSDTGPLTWNNFVKNAAYGFTNIDQGIWHTIRMLFTHPGTLFHDYISGRRRPYFAPFSLLVILAAIYEIILRASLMHWVPAKLKIAEIAENAGFFESLLRVFWEWITNSSTAFMAFLMLPVYALGIRRTFRKTPKPKNFNTVEYIFLSAYMSCQRLLIGLPLIPYKIYGDVRGDGHYNIVYWGLVFGITWFDFKTFFGLSGKKAFGKTIKVYLRLLLYIVVGFIAFLIVLGLIAAVVILFCKLLGMQSHFIDQAEKVVREINSSI